MNDLKLNQSEFRRLDWRLPLAVFILVPLVFGPIAWWTGLADPALVKRYMVPWPVWWGTAMTWLCAFILFAIPLTWIICSRVLDLFGFFMAQNGFLMLGYCFLGTTAWGIEEVATEILQGGSLVTLFNTIGFVVLFLSLGLTYMLHCVTRARLSTLQASPNDYDRNLVLLLRVAGVGVAGMLILPMAVMHTVPMLAADPVASRALIESADLPRSLYNLGAALVPFVVGGLSVLIVRNPLRVLGIDGAAVCAVLGAQFLSGNRFPIAIALFVTMTLLTVERKWPRPVLVVAYIVFLLLLTGGAGFTGILRQKKGEMGGNTNIVQASLEQAFYGDNLIDLRDAAWVLSQWDFDPLMGRTYLGGLASMVPSGIFPLKKQWHLGLTGVRIVGMDPDEHFGLRVTFFGEAFLNFGIAGVIGVATILGVLFGTLLRALHLLSHKRPACLHYGLKTVILMQMCMPLANTSDAFTFWAMGGFLFLQWMIVDLPLKFRGNNQPSLQNYAQGRV